MISPADPARSIVVLLLVPPTLMVEFGLVIVSPPPPADNAHALPVQFKYPVVRDGSK